MEQVNFRPQTHHYAQSGNVNESAKNCPEKSRSEIDSRIRFILPYKKVVGDQVSEVEQRLDNDRLKSITEICPKWSGREEVLKRSAPEHNLSGYRPGDEELINYWEVKRNKPLAELTLQVLLNGEFVEHTAIDLYHLTQVCFLPYLIFSDLGVMRQLKGSGYQFSIDKAQQELDQVYLEKVSEAVGWGLFAKSAIAKGAEIGEYTGVVCDAQTGGSYCMEYASSKIRRLVVDAKYFGNHTRFVNHSANPNLEIIEKVIGEGGFMTVVFRATRDIWAGEQLFIDYGNSYWGARDVVELG